MVIGMNIFIGDQYYTSKHKFIFIGESHYIENRNSESDYNRIVNYLNIIDYSLKEQERAFSYYWYNNYRTNNKIQLNFDNYFNTDFVVKEVISNYEKGKSTPRPHRIIWIPAMIYNNLFGKVYDKKEIAKTLHKFCFMNYFTRPSLVQGKSILNNSVDNQKTFENLIFVLNQLLPNSIVFLSKRAYTSFQESCKLNKFIFPIEILNLRHPAYFKAWSKSGEDYLKLKNFMQRQLIKD